MLSLTSPRHTSTLPTPAVSYAQIAAIGRRRAADEVKSTPEQAFGAVQKIGQTARKPGVSCYIAAQNDNGSGTAPS